jgi:AAA domain
MTNMALLAVKRTGAADYPKHIKALICGPAGSGKTLISTTFPNPWFLSAEGGLMSIVERDIPYTVLPDPEGTPTYDALQEVKSRLEQTPAVREKQFGFPVDTLVVDTIDEVSRLLLSEKMAKERHDTATLQDYGWLKERMTWFVQGLRGLDIHVVFTCHLKGREIDGKQVLIPAIEGGFSEKIADYVDLALVLKSTPTTKVIGSHSERVIERFLQTFPDSMDWIKDRSGKLPYEIPVNFKDDYQRLAEYIYGPEGPVVSDEETETVAVEAEPEEAAPDTTEGRFECSNCSTKFDEEDQDSISKIKHGVTLCADCFKSKS